uniref:Uncharacterized protein n=1 Tax=Rhizophora mucronata TaxID=61149 RepID=A0A2P2QKQ9_RHIMU
MGKPVHQIVTKTLNRHQTSQCIGPGMTSSNSQYFLQLTDALVPQLTWI